MGHFATCYACHKPMNNEKTGILLAVLPPLQINCHEKCKKLLKKTYLAVYERKKESLVQKN